jgi:hypothetical protein
MTSETTYATFAAGLQEAFADLEQHMDNPDGSRLSSQGMLELTRDRLASLAAMLFAPGMPPVVRLEPAATWTDTRDDDGRWLAGSDPCPRGCSHVLMAHRSDVGCISCDCQHGIGS